MLKAIRLIYPSGNPPFTFAFVAMLSLACTLLGINAAAQAASKRPNLVLIMADDMGYECVGANGGTSYKTPHLDQLAKSSLRFEHCYSQPICTPSRVQIMTGIYNQRNYTQFGVLHAKAITFANLLKKAGYRTCIVGKWQLKGGMEGPNKFGFDEYCLWQLTRRPNRYPNPGFEINGKEVDFKNGEYGPSIVADYACSFIEGHVAKQKVVRKNGGEEQPFLLYYPMMLPHWPFEPTPDGKDWDATFRRNDKSEKGAMSDPVNGKKYFGGMVNYTDKMVGRVLATLDALGIRDNTVVMFTCDNGTAKGIVSKMTGGRVVHGGKGTMPDAGNHVPLIVNWPGKIKPGVTQDLVDFSDMLPTLCELGGAKVEHKIDGKSFAKVLTGEQTKHRDWTYCWYARNGGPKGQEFARNQRYKLYRTGKFVDVQSDPLEKSPVEVASLGADAQKVHTMLKGVLDQMEGTRVLPKGKGNNKPKNKQTKAK